LSETSKKLKLNNYGVAAFILVLCIIGFWVPSHVSVTVTPSNNKRIFYIHSGVDTSTLHRGSYVMFNLDPVLVHRLVKKAKTTLTIKQIKCFEGQHLKVEDRYYYCDDDYLGRAKTHSLEGMAVDNFVFNGVIPKGSIFVMGDHIDSFDSRYFGFIGINQVTANVSPII